ncbi:hypothetical protein MAIT1_03164 [Magnetofaba australis IT-1]|uniref:Uncharacterized protein n=1 Tax=Magnetofaba australis IT-1 TaxID=1434232 RepID=A0A1Y2K666_9PROT|nr:hypothetical protein MAIT1_03164 [Magnetofaba australis IT-1]
MEGKRAQPVHFEINALHDVAEPKAWVELHDYLLEGKRKVLPKAPPASYLPKHLRKPPPPKPRQPEADLTIYRAIEEIYAPTAREASVVHAALDVDVTLCREAAANRGMEPDELSACEAHVEEIRLNYTKEIDQICDWYLENMARVYDNPEGL